MLKSNVTSRIKELVHASINTQTIITVIYEEFKVAVASSTIKAYKDTELDTLFEKVKEIPHGKDALRLIALLESLEDISYVYVTHDTKSGLVTHTKPRKDLRIDINPILVHAMESKYMSEISKLRSSLSLSEDKQILISVCWASNEQVRKMTMFPEFAAADVSFNINKRKRNLFAWAIVDGHMSSHTVMRCFMPSKQTIAYIWPIAQAMPYLFGKDTTKRIHCLATDAEPALIDAIRLGTTTKHGYSGFIKHRLDCYHMFIQKWTDDICITSNMSVNLQTSLNDLRGWIHSWFKTIETISEYKYSRSEFDIVFNELKIQKEIKSSHMKTIEDILLSFDKRIDYCGHWNFKELVIFGFQGSSISEVENSTLKVNTPHPVKHTQSMEKSAYELTKQTKNKMQKKSRKMAADMNAKKLYSNSKTSDFLTDYMEGLALKYFDNRHKVIPIYVGDNKNDLFLQAIPSFHLF
jgi:hypothetical protein